jgi:hypothetical protein
MHRTFVLNRVFLACSLSISALVCGQFVAQAEAVKPDHNSATEQAPNATLSPDTAPLQQTSQVENSVNGSNPVRPTPDSSQPASTETQSTPLIRLEPSEFKLPISEAVSQVNSPTPSDSTPLPHRVGDVPVPGTVMRSISGLQALDSEPIAQVPVLAQGNVRTLYKFSYLGIGANLGAGGETGLGTVSFAAFSKFALNPYLSFRPSVLIGDHVSFLLPLTYDFGSSGIRQLAPFAGIGAKFSTGSRDNADLLLTAGVDYPLNPELALTASVNVGPINNFDIGFILGLAYTFSTQTITATTPSVSELIPRRPPRPNPSYLGVGINFGAGGDSGLGDIAGAVYGKLTLAPEFSFRPAIFFSSDVSFLLPVTYDFNVIRLTDYIRLAPYAGLGATFSTGQNNNASLLLTAGVDIPITDQFAATLGVNIAPVDGFSIGFLLGGAYTFGKF